jgi:hypothetical protein
MGKMGWLDERIMFLQQNLKEGEFSIFKGIHKFACQLMTSEY